MSNIQSGEAVRLGIPVVISGPAGVGKGSVITHFRGDPDYRYSVSATTRAPRPGETDGVSYYFITREHFAHLIRCGEMLEYTEYCGNFYGTPAEPVREALRGGSNVILEVETVGAANIKRAMPECVMIFIFPQTFRQLESQLRKRGTETEEAIIRRLARAKEEIAQVGIYDYVVLNLHDGQGRAAEDVRAVVSAEQLIRSRGGFDYTGPELALLARAREMRAAAVWERLRDGFYK